MAGPVALTPIAIPATVDIATIAAPFVEGGAVALEAAAGTAAVAAAAAGATMAEVAAAVTSTLATIGFAAALVAAGAAFVLVFGVIAVVLALLPSRSLSLTIFNEAGMGPMYLSFYQVHGSNTGLTATIDGGYMGNSQFVGASDHISGTAGVMTVSCDSIPGGGMWIAWRIPEVAADVASACGITLTPGDYNSPQDFYDSIIHLHQYSAIASVPDGTAQCTLVQSSTNGAQFTLAAAFYNTPGC
jgi:hypothetical protein